MLGVAANIRPLIISRIPRIWPTSYFARGYAGDVFSLPYFLALSPVIEAVGIRYVSQLRWKNTLILVLATAEDIYYLFPCFKTSIQTSSIRNICLEAFKLVLYPPVLNLRKPTSSVDPSLITWRPAPFCRSSSMDNPAMKVARTSRAS